METTTTVRSVTALRELANAIERDIESGDTFRGTQINAALSHSTLYPSTDNDRLWYLIEGAILNIPKPF